MTEAADLTTKQLWEELRNNWLRASRRDAILTELKRRYLIGDHNAAASRST